MNLFGNLFVGGKGIHIVKTWDVRPSLIWGGDDWRSWKENSIEEVCTNFSCLKKC